MTCIIGVEHKKKVYIGGDSAGTNEHMLQRIRDDKKVFVKDNFIFGYAGSFRMGQLIQHALKIPKFKGGDLHSFMVTEFIDSVRACLKADDLQPMFLVGHKGKLFTVQGDFQVGMPRDGFDAIGSGGDIAMGAMHVSAHNRRKPAKRIEEALRAASINNAAVRPPFTILSV